MAEKPTDAARFREVAETLRELGMKASAVVVGDIRVILSEPWGAEPPQTRDAEQATYVVDTEKAQLDEKLKRLRKKSRLTFGHVKPDEVLLRMDGIL